MHFGFFVGYLGASHLSPLAELKQITLFRGSAGVFSLCQWDDNASPTVRKNRKNERVEATSSMIILFF
jgi:hypothetical protein